jgi:ABC-type transporter Mla subunit MlaD
VSAPTNHWKLGAFVLGTVFFGLTTVVILAARTLQIETVTYTSYFDEGVTGLEVGSAVSYRGVKIGNVSGIDVAPDRRHVEINYSLGTRVLRRLGLVSEGSGKETKISVPPDLRVQMAQAGLTGSKFILMDFFNVQSSPPPVLPFPVPENYIPATPSTMKNLEDAVIRAVDMIPDIVLAVNKVLDKVNLLLDDVNQKGLPARTSQTLLSANQLLGDLKVKLEQVQVKEMSQHTNEILKNADKAVSRLDKVMARVDGEQGLIASVQRTTDSLGDVAGTVAGEGLGGDLIDTARDLREAASALRDFLNALQRDPDMLLKGKAKHQ